MELTSEMIQKAMEGYVVRVDMGNMIDGLEKLRNEISGNTYTTGLLFGGVLVFTAFVTWKICSIERKLKKMEEKEEA